MLKGVNRAHQQDAEARDQALLREDAWRSSRARRLLVIKILTRQDKVLEIAEIGRPKCTYN